MATRTWVGGTSSVWSTASNWSPATVPVATDDVYIVSGSVDITGIDQSSITLNSLTVGTQYTGKIGSSSAKLQINATNFNFSGNGETNYIEGQFTTVTIQNTSTSANALNLYGSSDTITTLRVLGGRGTINIDSTCNLVTTIEQIGADGATLIIADGTTIGGSAALTMDSGKVEMNQAIPTVTVFGGELKSTLDSGTVTTINQYAGRIRWNPSASCTITNLNVYAGTFDSRDSTSPTFTVTNTTLHDGTIDERSGIENGVWTNPISVNGDGEVKFDTGRTVTIS
jgi:hypothetical protein